MDSFILSTEPASVPSSITALPSAISTFRLPKLGEFFGVFRELNLKCIR